MGWRVMNRCHDQTNKLLLVPTTATRAKTHWILDKKKSQGKVLTWTRAGKVMRWIPLPITTRISTFLRRADNRVSDVSPGLSPPPRKRKKLNPNLNVEEVGENHGCKCRLGNVCKHARLEAVDNGELPKGDLRLSEFPSTKKVRGKRDKWRREKLRHNAWAQRRCLGLPMDEPAHTHLDAKGKKKGSKRFSMVHWNPDYVRDYPKKSRSRRPNLIKESEARKYGMFTRWNPVSTKYDGTPKVMAIPNYLGPIHCEELPYERERQVARPSCWERSDPSPTNVMYRSPSSPTPTPSGTVESVGDDDFRTRRDLMSPDIFNGSHDGAKKKEFTGMRAEFTSAEWFESARGKANRRMHSWYGYFGGNMDWHSLMTLLVKVIVKIGSRDKCE